jgi:DNA-binding transcriptional LysR family regulator
VSKSLTDIAQALSPQAIAVVKTVAEQGSMAAAARELNLVPSALTYRIRQIEDTLDVLLFDRSARHAKLTPAGVELLREGERVLMELQSVANRVKRVATGWEPQITIAVDSIINKPTVYELVEAFWAAGAPTRVRLLEETLSGTWHALVDGRADLALGVVMQQTDISGIQSVPLGDVPFVFAVAPHHPLATAPEPLADATIQAHRVVAVADSTQRNATISVGILSGQDVFTVANMQAKLDAQLRGMGCGNLPQCLAQPFIDNGRLVVKATERAQRVGRVSSAWRAASQVTMGEALKWWVKTLQSAATQHALLTGPACTPKAP